MRTPTGRSVGEEHQFALQCHNLMQVDANIMTRSIDTEIKRVTVTLPRRQLDALQHIASREDVSIAWLVRKAVDKLLRDGLEMASPNRPEPAQGSRK